MKIRLIWGLLCFLLPLMSVQGQEFAPYERLYMVCYDAEVNPVFHFGEICSWAEGESELRQETFGQYMGDLVISPDGTKIAYLELPPDYVSALQRNEDPTQATQVVVVEEKTTEHIWNAAYVLDRYPTNVGIMELSTSETVTLTEQDLPPDADEWVFQHRSLPVWSPDSTQFAWLERDLTTDSFAARIMRYDTRTNSVEIVASRQSFGYVDGGNFSLPDLLGWGNVISYKVFSLGVYDESVDSSFGEILVAYDETGKLSNEPISYFANFEDSFTSSRLVLHGDEWRLAIHYPNLGWVLYAPLTNSYTQVDSPPYLAAITDGGWRGYLVDTLVYPPVYEWQSPETLPEDFDFGIPSAIDPNGIPIWSTENGLSRFLDGEFQRLSFQRRENGVIGQAVWMPTVWHIEGEATPIEKTVSP